MMELLRQMAEQLRGIEFPPEAQENVNAAIAYLDCAFYDMYRPAPRALDLRPCGHSYRSTALNTITGETFCAECAGASQ